MKMRELDADGGPKARPAGRLYGAESETAVLASALDAVVGRRSRLLSLEGAAGLGKSALLGAARADARRRGWTVLSGRATILETANAFGVLRQVLAGLPPLPDGRPATALVPARRDVSAFEVFELVSAHLREIVASAPVLITLDDLQWCDPLTLRWLAYLAHRSADLPIALVLATSPAEMSEHSLLFDELVAAGERRTLRRLTTAQVKPWISDVMGARPDDAFAAGCHRATGGNPALLAALLPALAARSVPPVRESLPSIESVGRAAVGQRMLPWIVRGGPEATAVAEAVVVLGDESDLVLVGRLAGLALDDAATAVDRLIKMDILSDTSPLRYVHALVRAAVDAGISTGLRMSRRLRAARLVRDHYADPGRAAAHLMDVEVSGERWVLDTLRTAAGSALEEGSPQQALDYLRRALAEPMPGSTRAELLAEMGAAEMGAGVTDGETTLLEALALAAEPSLRARIGVDLAHLHADAGRPLSTALKVIDEACAPVPPGRAEVLAEAELGAFNAYAVSADADDYVDRRLPALRELTAGDDRLSALVGVVDAWSGVRRGCDREESVRRARSALSVIDPQTAWEARLRLLTVGALIAADEYVLADDPGETGGRSVPRRATASEVAIATHLRGAVLHGRGELESAAMDLGAALEDPLVAGGTGGAHLLRVLTEIGDLDEADRLVREYGPVVQVGSTWTTALFAFAKASLCMVRDHHQEALDGFLEAGRGMSALGIVNPALSSWRSQAARCMAALGDTRTAADLVETEVGLARRWGAPRALSTALAAAGVVNLDPDAGLEAVAVLDPLDADLHRATALVDLGTVLLETGATDRAHEYLQDGFALAHTIKARSVSRRASRYIKRSGGKPDLGRIGGLTALTGQERAAAERAAAGATNRQIAEEMVLTQRTVEQYLTSVYRKLGITGRRQLAAALSG